MSWEKLKYIEQLIAVQTEDKILQHPDPHINDSIEICPDTDIYIVKEVRSDKINISDSKYKPHTASLTFNQILLNKNWFIKQKSILDRK